MSARATLAALAALALPHGAESQVIGPPPDLPDPTEVTSADSVPVARSPFEVAAREAGMSEEALARVDSILREAVVDGVTPGAALAVGRRGRIVRMRGYGWLDRSEGARIATPATLYDLASLTKPVAAATAVMILVDEGRLGLDDAVARHLPWWAEGGAGGASAGHAGGAAMRERVTVRDLLLHRAGLPGWRPFWREHRGRADFRRALAATPLERPPGVRSVYSDLGYMTLAYLVEAVAGEPLEAFLRSRVWIPLGMTDTGFRPDSALLDRIAPTEVDTILRHRHVRGEVHDENAWAMGGVSGHAGLFSTVWDLAIFAQTMLEDGRAAPCATLVRPGPPCAGPRAPAVGDVDGADGEALRIVSAATARCFTTAPERPTRPGRDDAPDDGAALPVPRSLGWDVPTGRSSAGDYFGPRSFGHTGFTGTSIWIDPDLDLFVVLLTNRVNPTRENTGHVALRREVHDGVALAVTDVPVRTREEVLASAGAEPADARRPDPC